MQEACFTKFLKGKCFLGSCTRVSKKKKIFKKKKIPTYLPYFFAAWNLKQTFFILGLKNFQVMESLVIGCKTSTFQTWLHHFDISTRKVRLGLTLSLTSTFFWCAFRIILPSRIIFPFSEKKLNSDSPFILL